MEVATNLLEGVSARWLKVVQLKGPTEQLVTASACGWARPCSTGFLNGRHINFCDAPPDSEISPYLLLGVVFKPHLSLFFGGPML